MVKNDDGSFYDNLFGWGTKNLASGPTTATMQGVARHGHSTVILLVLLLLLLLLLLHAHTNRRRWTGPNMLRVVFLVAISRSQNGRQGSEGGLPYNLLDTMVDRNCVRYE